MKKTKNAPCFWLYGHHAVVEALKNPNRQKLNLRMTNEVNLDKDLIANIPTQIVSRQEIQRILPDGAVHQGLALQVRPLENDWNDFLHLAEQKEQAVVVILDQVTDPHNIGAILRSAAAFEALAVIIPENNAPEESGTLAKSACGGLEIVPLLRVTNLVRAMKDLKDIGFWCLGMDGRAKQSISDKKLPIKTVFVMGSEGEGLRRLTAENCDYMVKLPISPKMESLNVSNATAICLYEFSKAQQSS